MCSVCLRFSGLLGALGGPGYNGLPSMVGLDDSISDVAIRKKYPFELEKAIHNVKFIQHHMQRQDDFDAVRGGVAGVLVRGFEGVVGGRGLRSMLALTRRLYKQNNDTKIQLQRKYLVVTKNIRAEVTN